MKKIVISAILLLPFYGQGQGVFERNFGEEFLPTAPDAASISKMTTYPVDYSSGLVNITIPLYEIRSGNITVPLSLNYHASGIKVADEAGWTGLGWTLSAGGNITRSVHGSPDETGFLSHMPTPLKDDVLADLDANQYQLPSYAETSVYQPDQFYVTAPGVSTEFIFDNDRQPVAMPYNPNLTITKGSALQSFTVKSDDGNTLVFGDADETHNAISGLTYTTSWNLESVEDIYGNEVDFIYDNGGTIYLDNQQQSQAVYRVLDDGLCLGSLPQGLYPVDNEVSSVNIATRKLSEIHFYNGKLLFHSSFRDDIPNPAPGGQMGLTKLDSISLLLKDESGYTKRKVFIFLYSYFICPNWNTTIGAKGKRLKLDEVVEVNIDPVTYQRTSKFLGEMNYEETINLPPKNSFSQDYWGYYNGQVNSNLLPPVVVYSGNTRYELGGANRLPNEAYMKANTLKAIAYPNNTTRHFEYEANRYAEESYITDYIDHNLILLGTGDGSQNPDNLPPDPGNPPYASATYTFTSDYDQPMHIPVLINYYGSNALHDKYSYANYTITWGSNTITRGFSPAPAYISSSEDHYISIDKGEQFTISVQVYGDEMHFEASIAYDDVVTTLPYTLAGGLRIKKQTVEDQGALSQVFNYSYEDTTGAPSGYVVGSTKLDFTEAFAQYIYDECELNGNPRKECDLIEVTKVFSSSNNNGITNSTVAYSSVKVEEGTGSSGNGSTFYTYVKANDILGNTSSISMVKPTLSRAFVRRDLASVKLYDENNNKKSENIYSYDWIGDAAPQVLGFIFRYEVVAPFWPLEGGPDYVWGAPSTRYSVFPENYKYFIDWHRLRSQTSKTYFNNGAQKITTVNNFSYHPGNIHMEPRNTDFENSTGEDVISYTLYPQDFHTSIPAYITTMKNEHMFSYPVCRLQKVDNVFIGGRFVEYKVQNGVVVPYKVYELETSSGVATDLVSTILSNGVPGSDFVLKYTFAFDDKGKLTEKYQSHGNQTSLIWNDGRDHVIAKVENSRDNCVAYTSFEFEASGNFTYLPASVQNSADLLPSGKNYYQLGTSADVTITGLPEVAVMVSFWAKDGSVSVNGNAAQLKSTKANGWNYYEITLPDPSGVTVSGTAKLDELRMYPAGGQMMSYTYDPRDGVTNISDPRSDTRYYRYDGRSLLHQILDEEGSVEKNFENHHRF